MIGETIIATIGETIIATAGETIIATIGETIAAIGVTVNIYESEVITPLTGESLNPPQASWGK
jgi:hypothetical protein